MHQPGEEEGLDDLLEATLETTLEATQGQRNNTLVYIHKGYFYYKDRDRNGSRYFKCKKSQSTSTTPRCGGRMVANLDLTGIRVTEGHNHEEEPTSNEVTTLRRQIIELCLKQHNVSMDCLIRNFMRE